MLRPYNGRPSLALVSGCLVRGGEKGRVPVPTANSQQQTATVYYVLQHTLTWLPCSYGYGQFILRIVEI
jgi:hypothetical protein